MSRNRYAAKVDTIQPAIVADLRALGIGVWIIGHPVDLLLRFYCNRHHDFCFMALEIKTPQGKKNPKGRIRKEQVEQNEFMAATNTPAVTSLEGALFAINARHRIEGVNLQTPLRTVA